MSEEEKGVGGARLTVILLLFYCELINFTPLQNFPRKIFDQFHVFPPHFHICAKIFAKFLLSFSYIFASSFREDAKMIFAKRRKRKSFVLSVDTALLRLLVVLLML